MGFAATYLQRETVIQSRTFHGHVSWTCGRVARPGSDVLPPFKLIEVPPFSGHPFTSYLTFPFFEI